MRLSRVASRAQLRQVAADERGPAGLRADGWRKVELGVTTIDEVLRVTQDSIRSGGRGALMTITYRYRTARSDGIIEEGSLDHADRGASVLAHLSDRGLFAIDVEASSPVVATHRAMSASDLAIGLRTLATLIDSGLPVGRALAAFTDVAPTGWLPGLGEIRNRVKQGESLAVAMEQSNIGLPRLLTGVIRAGEAGSGVALAMNRAADLAESSAKLRAAVQGALAYPALLAVVGAASIGIIVLVVSPRFAEIIADVGGDVPPLARFIMSSAHAIRVAAIPGLMLALAAVVLWRSWMTGPESMARFHRALLGTPLLGGLRMCAASSRACAALAALLGAGVPIAVALRRRAAASGDFEIERPDSRRP